MRIVHNISTSFGNFQCQVLGHLTASPGACAMACGEAPTASTDSKRGCVEDHPAIDPDLSKGSSQGCEMVWWLKGWCICASAKHWKSRLSETGAQWLSRSAVQLGNLQTLGAWWQQERHREEGTSSQRVFEMDETLMKMIENGSPVSNFGNFECFYF